MSFLLAWIPVLAAAVLAYGLHRINRKRGWLRTGELIFWDAIILIVLYLLWLRWF